MNDKEPLHKWLQRAPVRRLGIVNTRFEFIGGSEYFFIRLRKVQLGYVDSAEVVGVTRMMSDERWRFEIADLLRTARAVLRGKRLERQQSITKES